MLKEFHLKNYQSHKDSSLVFHPGLNAIVGASDSGKSAIMRAIFAVLFNTKCGIPQVSRWAKTPKKAIKKGEELRLTLVNDDHTVERYRNAQNGYIVDGENLEAIGTQVPDKVSRALNITDVNVHQQDDPYFLLSASNGEAGKYINKMVNLQEIDQFTSAMKSEVTKVVDSINVNEEDLKSVKAELESLSWVDKGQELLTKIEALSAEIHDIGISLGMIEESLCIHASAAQSVEQQSAIIAKTEQYVSKIKTLEANIGKMVGSYTNAVKSLDAYAKAKEAIAALGDMEGARKVIEAYKKVADPSLNEEKLSALLQSIEAYNKAKNADFGDLEKVSEIIAKCKGLEKRIGNLSSQLESCYSSMEAHHKHKNVILECESFIVTAKAQIESLKPLICPTCGQERKNHEH